jgi:hypothetical protein
MGFIDSDDDFPGPSTSSKKSRLSRKKSNKENARKPHTSTQMEQPEPIQGRGGRPSRKSREEAKFQDELEAALKMSSEEVTSSSGEVLAPGVPPSAKNDDRGNGIELTEKDIFEEKLDRTRESPGDNKVKTPQSKFSGNLKDAVNVEDIMEAEGISQESARTEDQAPYTTTTVPLDNEEEFIFKKKVKPIVSEDEFETDIGIKNSRNKKVDDTVKRRKVDEAWVVSGNKKDLKDPLILRVLRKEAKKYLDSSASEDEFSDEFVKEVEEDESDEEFTPVQSKKKTTKIKDPRKKESKVSTKPEPESLDTNHSEPTRPLGPHNPVSPAPPTIGNSPAYRAPRRLNIDGSLSKISPQTRLPGNFQSPVLSKPPTSAPIRSPIIPTPNPSTPSPAPSISSLLSSLPKSLVKSCPPPSKPSPLPTGQKIPSPGVRKMPAWTPPSKVGKLSLSSPIPNSSPSIGLRVGLSRNWKAAKPLHSTVKYPT